MSGGVAVSVDDIFGSSGSSEEEESEDVDIDEEFKDSPAMGTIYKFWKLVAEFQFDKAKEIMGKDKDQVRSKPLWIQFFSLMARMSQTERNYMGLTFFLPPKGFLRKENTLKNQLEILTTDLTKLEEASSAKKDKDLNELVTQTRSIAVVRVGLISMLEKAHHMGTNDPVIDFEKLHNEIIRLTLIYESSLSHGALKSALAMLTQEVRILKGFIGCLDHLDKFDYTRGQLELRLGAGNLENCEDDIQVSKEGRKMSFMASTFFGSHADPQLYQWLFELKNAVFAKFNIYFELDYQNCELLTEEYRRQERPKRPVDHIAKFEAFQKEIDAFNISLVFDATNEPTYRGRGFRYEGGMDDPVLGLDLYPCAFSCPDITKPPLEYWPSLIMMLNDFKEQLDTYNKVVNFYDNRANLTFFLGKIDPNMMFVIMMKGEHQDTDHVIESFMKEMTQQLRCTKIFASLKPGTK